MPHIDLVYLSMMSYLVTILACVAGLFYTHYRDNWGQTAGMCMVGFGSVLKLDQVYHRGFVSEETALLAVGVASFAVGVAWKVWQYQRYAPPRTLS